MKLSSIVPSRMSRDELSYVCGRIQTAINWGQLEAKVELQNGFEYEVPVENLNDYRSQLSNHGAYTGGLSFAYGSH